jgi:uncharacterized membrane protein
MYTNWILIFRQSTANRRFPYILGILLAIGAIWLLACVWRSRRRHFTFRSCANLLISYLPSGDSPGRFHFHRKSFISARRGLVLSGGCLIAVLSLLTEIQGAIRYQLTDLGIPFGLRDTEGIDVNNNGTILVRGWAYGWFYAYLWKNGALTLIRSADSYTSVLAINDNEWVTGYSSNDAMVSNAFVWRNGSFTYLGEIAGGQNWGRPHALNNGGKIYGYSLGAPNNTAQAFSWLNGQFTTLGIIDVGFGTSSASSFYDESYPWCINDQSQLVGVTKRTEYWSGAPSTMRVRSWLMENGVLNVLPIPSGVTPETWQTNLINASGDIIGRGKFADGYHYGLWSNGTITELPDLPGGNGGQVLDMNAHGQAVGQTYIQSNYRALL